MLAPARPGAALIPTTCKKMEPANLLPEADRVPQRTYGAYHARSRSAKKHCSSKSITAYCTRSPHVGKQPTIKDLLYDLMVSLCNDLAVFAGE